MSHVESYDISIDHAWPSFLSIRWKIPWSANAFSGTFFESKSSHARYAPLSLAVAVVLGCAIHIVIYREIAVSYRFRSVNSLFSDSLKKKREGKFD